MKAISQFLLASAMLGDSIEMHGNSKASQRTLTRKSERQGHTYNVRGINRKTSQGLKDTKDKFDKPTGVMVVNERKTHRNDDCICGSEKKFKNCCLGKAKS